MNEFRGKPVASSKKEAMEKRLSFYWTGVPCPKGHIAPRFRSGGCTDCYSVPIGRENWKPRSRTWNPQKSIDMFWSKVDKSGDCWVWTGLKDKDGYGKWGKSGRAHRFAYTLMKGSCDGKDVLHRCDNPRCVNPEHLWLGDTVDNTRDRNEKRRQASRHKIRASWPVSTVIEAYWEMKNGMTGVQAHSLYGFSMAMCSLVRRARTWHFRVDA